jgi:hypothetical protein
MVSGMSSVVKMLAFVFGMSSLFCLFFEVDIPFRQLLDQGESPEKIAEELSDLAIRLGSSDNVTIVIVQFLHD